MRYTKRMLAWMLAFVMILTSMPTQAYAQRKTSNRASTATTLEGTTLVESESNNLLDAAIFCSDVHGSTTDTNSVFSGIKNSGTTYSTATFVGDTFTDTNGTVSSVTTVVKNALSDGNIQCYYTYGTHDSKSDIKDSTGLLYAGENYYIYAISQTDMESETKASSAASEFTAKVANLDKTKPLFIASHMPLHQRRGDNKGAATWYDAISAVAEDMDIIFLWAHNHTTETYVDRNAYYVEKNGNETIAIQGGSTVRPNFTYMNAGYINANNQEPARKGIATTVQIYSDSMVFQDYNSSGAYTGTYAHNVTVTRDYAEADDNTEDGSGGDADNSTETTIPENAEFNSLKVTAPENPYYFMDTIATDLYAIADDINVTAIYTLNGTEYSKKVLKITDDTTDGYTLTLNDDNITPGEKTVTISYKDGAGVSKTKDITIYVCESNSNQNNTNADDAECGDVYVTFDTPCATSVTIKTTTVKTDLSSFIDGDYVAYDITPAYAGDYTELEGTATVTLPIPDGVENPVVYYVSDDGKIEDMKAEKDEGGTTVTFETDHFSTYAIGEAATELESTETIKDSVSTTTTTNKTVYKLVNSITSGKKYLIVNSNSTGSGYALKNNNGSVGATSVTVKSGSLTINGTTSTETYIELDDATNELWTATESSNKYTFKNDSYYLLCSRSSNSLKLSKNDSNKWTYLSNQLYYYYYYLCYNDSWELSSKSSNVYLYEETENAGVTSEGTEEKDVTYSVQASDVEHINDQTDSKSGTESIEKYIRRSYDETSETVDLDGTYTYAKISDGSEIIEKISDDGVITFTGKTGTAQVRVYYTFEKNEQEYKIWTTINVTARNPYYTVDIVDEDSSESITDTIVIKGVTGTTTYDLLANVYLNGDGEPITVESTVLKWESSDDSVASVDTDGKVTFTGKDGTVQITVHYEYKNNDDTTSTASDTVTFSVTQTQYIVPSDGTSDFPEYPNEGSVRYDKTATAVGDFSQTGIAQVELSMTGVPYTRGSEIDVVLMLDMTGSMSDDDMTAAEESAIIFADSIVKNEDGTYNDNRIAVYAFNKGGTYELWSLSKVTADTWNSFSGAVRTASDKQNSGGTPYDIALSKCREVLETAKTDGIGNNREQYCIFVSDGGPTSYTYITNYDAVKAGTATQYETSTASVNGGGSITDSNYSTIATSYSHEYYSTLMKDEGVTIYTVGTGMTTSTYPNCCKILQNIATDSEKAYFVASSSDTSSLGDVFSSIALEITQAATNVVVEDKIGEMYSMNFSLPGAVTKDDTGMDEFYIQVVEYELDSNNNRTTTYTVLENFTFYATGKLKSHTLNATECKNCSHVTITDGKVTKIEGTYFTYYVEEDGSEMLKWTADKLTSNELALQYFVYLDNSAGLTQDEVNAGQETEAGNYATNEWATLTYTNYLGNECRQEFPIPQMTWKGAQVTYVFYLVNDKGIPVNRSGVEVPFSEAIYVTNPYIYSVTWNKEEGIESLQSDYLASNFVPAEYELYDKNASYELRVFETEGVSDNARNYNYFKISGSEQNLNSYKTTKVFNTKSGTIYDSYGVYSAQVKGTSITTADAEGNSATVTVDYETEKGFQYADTTVAFAVMWKAALVEDVVVVDYGLDVVINVNENDGLATTNTGNIISGVNGVMSDENEGVKINTGIYTTSKATNSISAKNGMWNASKESLTSIRFHQNKIGLSEPVKFYYEHAVNFSADGYNDDQQKYMYSSVTVIPATTIYYEDDFLDFKSYTKDDSGTYVEDIDSQWTTEGKTKSVEQDVDRPGVSNVSKTYDANNLYGYDSAYEECSEYSLGSAKKITVRANTYGTATFSFYGTGLDVIGLTSNQSGTLTVKVVKDEDKTVVVKNTIVDTYYGYAYDQEKSEWITTDSNDPNALYQVPVMKITDLPYAKYTVTIKAAYNSIFDHVNNEDGTYDVYLDAIRIYDPCGSENATANEAYIKDGEAYPEYYELRNAIIDANTFNSLSSETTTSEDGDDDATTDTTSDTVSGIVFIDGGKSDPDGTVSIQDYTSYGPNNELYLDVENAVAFDLNATANTGDVASVQLAIKTVGGAGKVEVYGIDSDGKKVSCLSEDINTATDMYYDITTLNGMTVVIKNAGSTGNAIISLTNVKVTYTEAQTTSADDISAVSLFSVSVASVNQAIRTLSAEDTVDVPEVDEEESKDTEGDSADDTTTDTSDKEKDDTAEDNSGEDNSDVTDDTAGDTTNEKQELVETIKKVVDYIFNKVNSFFRIWFH